jgi:LuxR family maltose regulon positive regulatory protein
LLQGDVTVVARWAENSKLRVDDDISFQNEIIYCTLSRVLIAQGELDEALRLLARLMKMTEAAAANGYLIELLILKSIALQKQGKMERALTASDRAISLAAPEGYVRSFINEGAPMAKLLCQATTRGTAVNYTGRLLAALEKETEDKRWMTKPASFPLVEPLTERELEVMRLLTTHLTSTDIAAQLTISANTVRTHTKSIYSKLDVHSREEAVQKAEKLNLL